MNKRIAYIIIILFPSITFAQDQPSGKFIDLDEALRKPKEVVELQLSGINEKLPSLEQLTNLKIVRLINLSADYDLKDAFEKLSRNKVEELYLYGNAHKELPQEISTLAYLKKVELDFSLAERLENTLDILSQNKQMEYIGLRGFRLIFLPNELLKFKTLKKLNLGDNSSLDYEQVFDLLSKIETIESINLDFNYFDGIPKSILKLKNLKELEFSMVTGRFNTPETYQTLSNLTKLEYLDISGNFFGELPSEIFLLKNLKTLNIDGNGISGEAFEKIKTSLPDTKIININPY